VVVKRKRENEFSRIPNAEDAVIEYPGERMELALVAAINQ